MVEDRSHFFLRRHVDADLQLAVVSLADIDLDPGRGVLGNAAASLCFPEDRFERRQHLLREQRDQVRHQSDRHLSRLQPELLRAALHHRYGACPRATSPRHRRPSPRRCHHPDRISHATSYAISWTAPAGCLLGNRGLRVLHHRGDMVAGAGRGWRPSPAGRAIAGAQTSIVVLGATRAPTATPRRVRSIHRYRGLRAPEGGRRCPPSAASLVGASSSGARHPAPDLGQWRNAVPARAGREYAGGSAGRGACAASARTGQAERRHFRLPGDRAVRPFDRAATGEPQPRAGAASSSPACVLPTAWDRRSHARADRNRGIRHEEPTPGRVAARFRAQSDPGRKRPRTVRAEVPGTAPDPRLPAPHRPWPGVYVCENRMPAGNQVPVVDEDDPLEGKALLDPGHLVGIAAFHDHSSCLLRPSRRCGTTIITTRPLYLPFKNIKAHSPHGPERRLLRDVILSAAVPRNPHEKPG